VPTDKALGYQRAWRQVCIYAFTSDALEAFVSVPAKTPLEEIEDIEILRFLELGIPVWMVHASKTSLAVDHPADIERVEAALRETSGPDR
jgi:3-deoxy-manno-octulosonate cytidylyltransferase (CMP-KDO synthetase)